MSTASQAINTGTSAIAQLANSTSSSSNTSSSSTAGAAGTNASQQLAGNFDTFLQLLTTSDNGGFTGLLRPIFHPG
jgi:hypothetical protein